MSQKFGTRPSEFLNLSDPWERWCVDETVFVFGSWLEGELDKASEKKKPEDALAARKLKFKMVMEKRDGAKIQTIPMNKAVQLETGEEPRGRSADMPKQGQFADPAEIFKRLRQQREG